MIKTELSKNGLQVSKIIAGCMLWGEWGANLSAQQAASFIEQCNDIGVTTFDHADIYGHYTTEKLFGDATKLHKISRDKLQLITKCGIQLITPNRPETIVKHYKNSKEYIISSVEQSLRNLNTDYIDVLLLHRPSPLMNLEEIAEAFTLLQKQGKALHLGVSNFNSAQFEILNSYIPLVTNQIEISAVQVTPFVDGTLDTLLKYKVKPMAYSVLAGGVFFNKNENEQVSRIKKVAKSLTEKYNCTIDQILLAFVQKHPSGIIPVVGTTKFERIKSAIASIDVNLSLQDWFILYTASIGEEVA